MKALVYSGVWIGVACAMQVAYSFLLLGLVPDLDMMLCFGLATVAVYNWQRLIKVKGRVPELHSERHQWISRHTSILWGILVVCTIISFYLLIGFSERLVLSVFLLSWLAFFYTLPWFSGSTRKGLRELPYLKIFLIAICWAGVTAFLPLLEVSTEINTVLLLTADRFLFILAITIPFDVRDLAHDAPEKRTIPQVMGVSYALNLASILCFLSFAIVVGLVWMRGELISYGPSLIIGYLLTLFLIRRSSTDRHELYFTGAVDGVLVLLPLLLWLSVLCGL